MKTKFFVQMDTKDTGHVPQKNYKNDPVDCDVCHIWNKGGKHPEFIILVGGGWRECIDCHLRKCQRCEITARAK